MYERSPSNSKPRVSCPHWSRLAMSQLNSWRFHSLPSAPQKPVITATASATMSPSRRRCRPLKEAFVGASGSVYAGDDSTNRSTVRWNSGFERVLTRSTSAPSTSNVGHDILAASKPFFAERSVRKRFSLFRTTILTAYQQSRRVIFGAETRCDALGRADPPMGSRLRLPP